MKKKKKVIIAIFVALICTGLTYMADKKNLLHIPELKSVDLRMRLANKGKKPHEDVEVILVDEASLLSMKKAAGSWPWPRHIWSELLEFLSEAGAKAVLFDILFTEPQEPRMLDGKVDPEGELGEDDTSLFLASGTGEQIYHAFQLIEDHEDEINKNLLNLPIPEDFVDKFSLTPKLKNNEYKPFRYNTFYLPFKELYQATWGIGNVEFSADSDGIYRSSRPLRGYQGHLFPTLPMAFLLDEFKDKEIALYRDRLSLGEIDIPFQYNESYLINMTDNFEPFSIGGIFSTIKASETGNTENIFVDPEDFKGKIVFVGGSAVGIEDLKQTSMEKVPGVYLHASFTSNILNQDFIKVFPKDISYAFVAVLAILTALFILLGSAIFLQLLPFLLMSTGYVLFSYYLFAEHLTWIPVVGPVITLFLTFIAAYIYHAFTEGKDKKFLKAAFGNYISPELIEMMHESGESPKLGGDVGILTAYFTDIQSFSSFSEKLSAPQLVELLNEYLSAMTDILLDEQGTLDKYEGDAIIAFFGAPFHLEDHAQKACRTAVRMQNKLEELKVKWRSEGDKWPLIVHNMRMRIGINSGEIVTGNMGSKTRMNYTMMGDSVNLAARLEEAAKQYGIFTQISHFTADLLGKDFILRELDTMRVVGKQEPVTTFEVLGEKGKTDDSLLILKEEFETALKLYKEQKWDRAIDAFKSLDPVERERFPDRDEKAKTPCSVYIERCEMYKENPPPQPWDGVYILTSK